VQFPRRTGRSSSSGVEFRGTKPGASQRIIVETSRIFFKQKLWRAQHRRVTDDHRVSETISLLQRAFDDRQKTIHFLLGSR
jgi:hypothetical protein